MAGFLFIVLVTSKVLSTIGYGIGLECKYKIACVMIIRLYK